MNRSLVLLLTLFIVAGSLGCASGAGKGAMIGAAAGAVIGGVVAEDTATGVIVGAALGGAAGAAIGDYMDKQAEELEGDLEGAEVERIGEGIRITFDSGLLFAVNQADLSLAARENLTRMGTILNEYGDTNILIEGHTDATGSDAYNQGLSERRAKSVSAFLASRSVAPGRMTVVGYGETQPVADNATAEGRAANRRVEVAIIANEKLKEQAAAQAKG